MLNFQEASGERLCYRGYLQELFSVRWSLLITGCTILAYILAIRNSFDQAPANSDLVPYMIELVAGHMALSLDGGAGFITALAVAVLSVFASAHLLRILKVDVHNSRWIIGGLFLGTSYWPCVFAPDTRLSLAYLLQLLFILLATAAAVRPARPYLCAFLFAAAMLSQLTSVYSALLLLMLLFVHSTYPRSLLLLLFLSAAAGSVAISVACHTVESSAIPSASRIPMVPGNFARLLLQGFSVDFAPPGFLTKWRPTGDTSLTFASPFLLFCFRAGKMDRVHAGGYISAGLVLCHTLLVYHDVTEPRLTHYTGLDMIPCLLLLLVAGFRKTPSRLWKAAITYSVVLNAIAYILIPLGSLLYENLVI